MKSIPNLHQHYSLLLGLISPWTVVNVDLNLPEKRVEIEVKWPIECMVPCPECGKNCPPKDHRKERRWRHLDTMQFQTIIKSRVPRSECTGQGSRFTLLFERFVIDVILASKSLKEAVCLLDLSWNQVHHIQSRAVERGLESRKLTKLKNVVLRVTL